MTTRTRAVATLCAAVGAVSLTASAAAPKGDPAATYPNRPVRVIVPFTPGGQPDIFARMVGEKLSQSLGQQIVVDNRAGAGGMTGSKTVADATPDGYTLLSISAGHVTAPAVRKLPYDVIRDFAGISMLYNTAYVLVVPPPLPVKTTQELVALAKAKPGQLNFGSAGVGSGTHFAAEMFKYAAKIDIVHVAYKGIPEAMTDTMANRVQLFMAPLASSSRAGEGGEAAGARASLRLRACRSFRTFRRSRKPGFRVSAGIRGAPCSRRRKHRARS